jgi:branched-chain amino acid transport system substrate-binding protein
MKSRTLKTALAVLGATLLAATASAQDTIKIGVTQPLTGAFAASGNYVAQGAKIAEEQINKSRTTNPTRPKPSARPRS